MLFPNMAHLARICRVIPIHTADVEWTFSQLKLVKTRRRNRMNERTLDSLLRITIEGPHLDKFPVSDTVELWASVKNRHFFIDITIFFINVYILEVSVSIILRNSYCKIPSCFFIIIS